MRWSGEMVGPTKHEQVMHVPGAEHGPDSHDSCNGLSSMKLS